ncbi:hypothetical protein K470DRAFT_194548, partial [Piedraia hortae CBS 480.64]
QFIKTLCDKASSILYQELMFIVHLPRIQAGSLHDDMSNREVDWSFNLDHQNQTVLGSTGRALRLTVASTEGLRLEWLSRSAAGAYRIKSTVAAKYEVVCQEFLSALVPFINVSAGQPL